MSCKKIKVGQLACAVAMGLIAAPSVQAQDASMSADGTTMVGSTEMSMTASAQPTLVSGNVLRYYVDRAGYVTAMDVQTDQGVQFVRFSPGMGQRLYSTYPVGGPVSVYVTGSPSMGATRYDVVSVGDRAPMAGSMMQPYMTTDAQMLDSPAYILPGSKMVTVSGRLQDLVVSDMGEIVGMVISTDGDMMNRTSRSNTVTGNTMMMASDGRMMKMKFDDGRAMVAQADGTMVELKMENGKYVVPESMTGAKMVMAMPDGRTMDMDTIDGKLMVMGADGTMQSVNSNGSYTMTEATTTDMAVTSTAMEPRGILVRVPRELRHIAPGYAGTERVTPLFKGADVEVTGYNEAPRFGTLSRYAQRVSASAIVVNSRAVGAVGIPMMQGKDQKALFNRLDIGGNSTSAEEMRASGMGYTVYGTSNSMGGSTTMTTDTTVSGTSSDGTTLR